jgi:hypothetical protein
MSIQNKVRLMENSLRRMKKIIDRKRDESYWIFMRREAWLHLERAIELYNETITEEGAQKITPEILMRLKFPDLADKDVNMEEVRYDLDRQEAMIRGYRCTVETFRPE